MATNTSALKTFAQQTRAKLVSLVSTKMRYVLHEDTAELRGYAAQIDRLRKEIAAKSEQQVIEEVAYTWFNRVMALRFMDANGYNTPMVVTPVQGQQRPEILQEAMGGIVDDDLKLSAGDKLLPEQPLYRKLLVAVCNQLGESMPFLFERIADYTELLMPDDLLSAQSFVSDIRQGMTDEDCQNVEIMGWLYQFYITDRKKDAEAHKSRKGGLKSDEQAAATQLFTPHWIVRYMVENSLGRIWMTLHPDSRLINSMPYYIKPMEGQTDVIPEHIHSAKDIKFLDLCMGSGHILVYAFDLFAKMYEEEGMMSKDIPALILQHNLYGMDIDRRCYQLTCFALTMKSRAYYGRYLRHTVQPAVIALQAIDHDVIDASGSWGEDSLMWQFENLDTIGSLLKVSAEDYAAIQVNTGLWATQSHLLKTQALFLSEKYDCVVTNPPYLGKGMGKVLKKFVEVYYPDSKYDLMAAFMERNFSLNSANGRSAMINQHSWMSNSSYKRLREKIIENYFVESLLHLGPRTFPEISGELVQNATFVIAKCAPTHKGHYIKLIDFKDATLKNDKTLEAINNSNCRWHYASHQKNFIKLPGYTFTSYWLPEKIINIFYENNKVGDELDTKLGMSTNDNGRFLRDWFEVSYSNTCFERKNSDKKIFVQKWFPYSKGGETRKWYGNLIQIINWEDNGKEVKDLASALYGSYSRTCKNTQHFFKAAITWSLIASGFNSFRYLPTGSVLGDAGPVCFVKNNINYVLALLNSKVVQAIIPAINPTMNRSTGVIDGIPLIWRTSSDVDDMVDESITISKLDWDAHETSWDFQSNELLTINKTNFLDVINDYAAVKNICIEPAAAEPSSLKWHVDMYEMKWEAKFLQLHKNEEELNRQFIEIYGLQDELTPDVPLNEVTILQKGEISIEDNEIVWHEDVIIKQFISYLVGCFMGRYSVDKPGLIIASQNQNLDELGLKVDGLDNGAEDTLTIDDDGIIPIVQEENFFADDMTERIEEALKLLFGEEKFHENMRYINQALGSTLRDYLYKSFYADHCAMYNVKGAKRPIYWMFSSKMGEKAKKGYFRALVYMHRMDGDTLSKLHSEYVHPYLEKVQQQLLEAEEQSGRDDLSTAQRNKALARENELHEQIREVEQFATRLAEMATHRQTIDLDDGVKANYPLFYPLVEPVKGLDKTEE